MTLALGAVSRVSITGTGADRAVSGSGWALKLGQFPAGIVAALERLISGPAASEAELGALAARGSGSEQLALWYFVLDEFRARGALRYLLADGSRQIAAWTPTGARPCLARAGLGPAPTSSRPTQLSRFAYVRRIDGTMVVESPRSPGPVELLDPDTLRVVWALRQPMRLADLEAATPGLDGDLLAAFVALLGAAGVLSLTGADGVPEEDRERGAADWDFADLVFHSATTTAYPMARTPSNGGAAEPDWRPEAVVPLEPADLDRLVHADVPLTRAMETRRSVRAFDDADPIGADELGALLDRVARIRRGQAGADGVVPADLRTYPSGGACYPLDLYLAVRCCRGLDAGLYRYEPRTHALQRLRASALESTELLTAAALGMASPSAPQLLLIHSARLGRSSRKYGVAGYALVLKEVGVLCEAFSLVATAMGLAGCALGSVAHRPFDRALAANRLEAEVAVGGFALGRPNQRIAPGIARTTNPSRESP